MNSKKTLWSAPWGYAESFMMAGVLLMASYFLEWLTGGNIQPPSFPANAIILALYIVLQVWIYLADRDTSIVRWLRSVPATVSAIALLAIQSVIMGTLPQQNMDASIAPHTLGFNHVMNSWPFAITLAYLLTILGQITLHRSVPLKRKNLPFIANHLGLWIALAAGTMGAGDIQRLTMTLNEHEAEHRATDGVHFRDMGFALQLDSFVMDTYPPKIALLHNRTNKLETKGINAPRVVALNDTYELGGYQMHIVTYLPNAGFDTDQYHAWSERGAAPAALIQVKGAGIDSTAWVSCGSFAVLPSLYRLNEDASIVMLEQEARKFESHVVVLVQGKERKKAVVEVNKPIEVEGWKIYQVSYDAQAGKYSTSSTLELVRDPWLPLVYVGIALMLLGALWLIFLKKENPTEVMIKG